MPKAAPSGMRVVVINDASTARGGATGLSLVLAKALAGRGGPVTYICGDDGDAPDLAAAGVEIAPLGGAHLLQQSRRSALVNGLYNSRARAHVASWIAAHDTPNTVYHLHGWSKILSPSVFSALKPVASRLVVHAHDFFLACPNGGYANFQSHTPCTLKPMSAACLGTHCDKRSYLEKLWRVGRHTLRRALFDFARLGAEIAVIHEDMADGLVAGGLPREAITAIRNPVTPFLTERAPAETNRKVVFVGRLFNEKGADLAARACHKAGAPFAVIGEGEDEAVVRAANPKAEFLGWRSRGDIESLIAQARTLVMPSRYPEPFGLVALEALMSGVPVVLARSALLAREIVDREMGLAVDPFDTDAFAAALTKLDRDDARVEAMSRRAFADAGALCLSTDAWVDQTVALYQKRLHGVGAAPEPVR